jgi:hypothetical protein
MTPTVRHVGNQRRRLPSDSITHSPTLQEPRICPSPLQRPPIHAKQHTLHCFNNFFFRRFFLLSGSIAESNFYMRTPRYTLLEHRIRFSSQRAYFKPILLLAPLEFAPQGRISKRSANLSRSPAVLSIYRRPPVSLADCTTAAIPFRSLAQALDLVEGGEPAVMLNLDLMWRSFTYFMRFPTKNSVRARAVGCCPYRVRGQTRAGCCYLLIN